jgi:hypothetical protein
MGRKKVTKRKQVRRSDGEGGYELVWDTVTEWVNDDSSSGGSDWSSSSDSSGSSD